MVEFEKELAEVSFIWKYRLIVHYQILYLVFNTFSVIIINTHLNYIFIQQNYKSICIPSLTPAYFYIQITVPNSERRNAMKIYHKYKLEELDEEMTEVSSKVKHIQFYIFNCIILHNINSIQTHN